MTTSTKPEEPIPTREKRFTVRGRVQGVGFRWWTRTQALRLGVTGTVRNRADGSVEVTARGEDGVLRSFRETLRAGPPGASVEAVEEEDATGVPRSSFSIEH